MIARRPRTLARPAELRGAGLHEGLDTLVRLLPAEAGAGIRFRRIDLEGQPEVPASVHVREERPRRTALRLGHAEVHTVEHLLAAVGCAGITDLVVEIDRVEIPGMDGSALAFLQAIDAAGVRDLDGAAPPLLKLDRPVEVEAGGARLLAFPEPGRLVLEYHLDYGGAIPKAEVRIDVTEDSFRAELAPARTFCLEREALMLRAAGLGKGATTQNTLVVGDDGQPLENAYRLPDECARHKALDLFGDLMLLGAALEARVVAYRSGHADNAALARALLAAVGDGANGAERAAGEAAGARAGAAAMATAAGSAASDVVVERPAPLLEDVRVEAGAVEAAFRPHSGHFAGHFPNQPVLPGVVSVAALEEAFAHLVPEAAGATSRALLGVRFRRVVGPGEALRARIERAGGEALAQLYGAGGDVVVEARFAAAEPVGAAEPATEQP